MSDDTADRFFSDEAMDIYFAFMDGKMSLAQFRAQMRDAGYTDADVDVILDNDDGEDDE